MVSAVLILTLLTSCNGNATISPTPEQTPGSFEQSPQDTINETVAVRFYYHREELDPGFDFPPEAYLYISEEIPVGNFEEEFIRLMLVHTGIHIAGFWYDGSKLYVKATSINPLSSDFRANFSFCKEARNAHTRSGMGVSCRRGKTENLPERWRNGVNRGCL